MNNEKLNVAIVGFGKMGMLHAGILNSLPESQLVAVCERNSLVRKFLKKILHKVSIVDSVEKLSNIDLDVVYVTTPIDSHFPVVKSLYENKIAENFFVEKPLASSFKESEKICKLLHKNKGVNMVGYMRRFSVTFTKARNLLEQEVIGEPVSFWAYAYSSDYFGVGKNSKVHAPKSGVIRDLGCHAIDLALWFFGDLAVKDAEVESIINDDSMDSAYFKVKGLRGLTGEFSVSWCVDGYRMPEVGFTIEGTNGSLDVKDDELTLKLNDGKKQKWFKHDLGDQVGFWLGSPEYYREDEQFIKAVNYGEKVEPCFETAAKVDLLIDEVLAKVKQNERQK